MTYYLFFFILLFLSEVGYFKVARFFNIIDKPNERSLHQQSTIRGGGVIYWFAIVLYFFYSGFEYPLFFIAITSLSLISFSDDIYNLSSKYRIPFHFFGILLLLFEINFWDSYSVIYTIPLLIIGVGILNAYNFMDGVNGITGMYSLVMLLSLGFINRNYYLFINTFLIEIMFISVVIFLIFNFRKKAICFGGDVGSVSIAYILLFLLAKLMFETQNIKFIFFFFLYGLDTIYTIIYRLQQNQNIFIAHKLHFFQILVYKFKFSHLKVASIYAALQLLLNIWVVKQTEMGLIFYIPFFLLLVLVHWLRKKMNLEIKIA